MNQRWACAAIPSWAQGFDGGRPKRIGLTVSVTATAGRTRTRVRALRENPILSTPSGFSICAARKALVTASPQPLDRLGIAQQLGAQAANWAVTYTCPMKRPFRGQRCASLTRSA